MKKTAIIIGCLFLGWLVFHPTPKADWEGIRAADDPEQTEDASNRTWEHRNFFITARAKYHIQAIVLSKHHYWTGSDEDKLAPYDLALGWGPMSDAKVINGMEVTQGGRYYEYHWDKQPPIDPGDIVSHSANTHILPADKNVLHGIKQIKRYDSVDLEGYLVDVVNKKDGATLNTSLTRSDSGGGACEVFWVTDLKVLH